MKHRIFGKKLGRNTKQRQSLWTNQVRSMFIHGKIKTTMAKAKSVMPIVESLAALIQKEDNLTLRRKLFVYLQDQTWVNNVVAQFRSVFIDQKSNFTTIKKIARRQGDDALIVEFAFCKPITFNQKKEKPVIEKTKVTKKEVKKSPPTRGKKKETK